MNDRALTTSDHPIVCPTLQALFPERGRSGLFARLELLFIVVGIIAISCWC